MSQIANKPLLHSVFPLISDQSKPKIKQWAQSIMSTLVEELLNCRDYFLRLSGFLDLVNKLFLITFKLS